MKLLERNKTVVKKVLTGSQEQKTFREGFKRMFGYEMDNAEKFPVLQEGFSFLKAKEKIDSKFKESDASSGFVFLLRAGIQQIVNNMYETVDTSFEQWTTVVQSKKKQELYAPLHGLSFFRDIGENEKFPEARSIGLDIELNNKKYGDMYSFSWELGEDDQTSQIKNQANLLGEYAKLLLEVLCMSKLASVASMSYADLKLSVSETQPSDESTWPWSAALVGGGATRLATYAVPTQPNITAALVKSRAQKNLLGLKMAVNPDTLLTGAVYELDMSVLAHSTSYASNVIATTAGTTTGGPLAINPLQGRFKPVISRFMFKNDGTCDGDSKAWYYLDSKKPWFVLQLRESCSITNEAPNAGKSFENDQVRFKARIRCNADIIDPRFCIQGSDGSI